MVLRHYGAVHVTLLPNRVISVFFSARFFTPKASEVPIPWVYTECFVENSTDDSPVPPARQPPASTLPWQTPPCSSPDLPIRSLPPAYTFHWASTQPAQHILCVRQPNQTHHLHRQRTKKKKRKETYGVRFLVLPPVGPAVPLSQTVYVDPNVPRTLSASPVTTWGVGPV